MALKKAWGYKCAYCNCTPTALTQDHVVPVTKGGEHTISNIVPACQSCNSAKGNRDVVEFALALEKGLLKCKRQH